MQFIDEAIIHVKAGDGGNGSAAFRREDGVPRGGPSGGDGGNGGSVIVVADSHLASLLDFKYKRHYKADRGEDGRNKDQYGAAGVDLTLKVPVGTVIYDEETNEPIVDLDTDGAQFVLAQGGVGGKGAGETSLELDRRRIRDRIAEIKHELSRIGGGAKTRRDRRSELPTVALVGYTNAGKSSLMRALTSSDVYVADKLFATLDTTVRRLVPPTEPPILVTDTVGFIKKLPHDLVASFRSTLDEASDSDLLLHVIDASDAAHAAQLAGTREVLSEIGADTVPSWLLLNKIDRVDDETRDRLLDRYPNAITLSAKRKADVAALRDRLIEHFVGALEEGELDVPWSQQRLVHVMHERTTVLAETHHDDGTKVRLRAPAGIVADLRAQLTGTEP